MNHIYRLIWNAEHQTFIAVPEFAKGRVKSALKRSGRGKKSASVFGFALSGLLLAMCASSAWALPTGANLVSGQATVTQTGQTLTINQSSQKTILDWQQFGIGQNETVNFVQPNASSVALNRVVGSEASQIFGHLNANGQVFLLNPNGVYFAPNAQVNVGGLIASTLNLSNQDFLNGNYHFEGESTASVINEGNITTSQGGYIAFIGQQVSNKGTLSTLGGKTALGAGGAVDLTLADNQLLSFKVSREKLNALASNGGLIQATGGSVILTAQAKDALLKTVVNNTGIIEAKGVVDKGGEIILLGGNSGTTQVAGTLDASPIAGGKAGFIETSGIHMQIDAATIHAGKGGKWLVDPVSLIIDRTAAETISNTLNKGTDVEQWVTENAATGVGVEKRSESRDIFVQAPIAWQTSATLSLIAWNSIHIQAPISATGNGNLVLKFNHRNLYGGELNIAAPVNLSTGSHLTINDQPYTLISTEAELASLTPPNGGEITGNYALINDITSSGADFSPIGNGK